MQDTLASRTLAVFLIARPFCLHLQGEKYILEKALVWMSSETTQG